MDGFSCVRPGRGIGGPSNTMQSLRLCGMVQSLAGVTKRLTQVAHSCLSAGKSKLCNLGVLVVFLV